MALTADSSLSTSATSHQKSSPKSALAKFCRKILSPKKAERPSLPNSTDPPPPATCSISSASTSSTSSSELQRVFVYFDENGDGKISPAELQTCVRTVGGELSEEEAQAAVEASDLDGDGLLDIEEFQKLMEATNGNEEDKNKELKDAFGMYEMEGSGGCITPTSLKRMLARLLGESPSIQDCKAMIRSFDLNGDGVLSFDEFRIMMNR